MSTRGGTFSAGFCSWHSILLPAACSTFAELLALRTAWEGCLPPISGGLGLGWRRCRYSDSFQKEQGCKWCEYGVLAELGLEGRSVGQVFVFCTAWDHPQLHV